MHVLTGAWDHTHKEKDMQSAPKGAESLPQSGEEHLVIECVIPASPSQKVMGDQQPEW